MKHLLRHLISIFLQNKVAHMKLYFILNKFPIYNIFVHSYKQVFTYIFEEKWSVYSNTSLNIVFSSNISFLFLLVLNIATGVHYRRKLCADFEPRYLGAKKR